MKILVTAGATREPIDRVRFLSNISSGATGALLVDELQQRGHDLTLLHGIESIAPRRIRDRDAFTHSLDLREKIHLRLRTGAYHAVIMAAVVSDYSPIAAGTGTVETRDPRRVREFTPNEKLLTDLKSHSPHPCIVISFRLTIGSRAPLKLKAFDDDADHGGVDAVVHNEWPQIRQAGTHLFPLFGVDSELQLRMQNVPALAASIDRFLSCPIGTDAF